MKLTTLPVCFVTMITSIVLVTIAWSSTDDKPLFVGEKSPSMLTLFLQKTLEYEKSYVPKQFMDASRVKHEITVFPAYTIKNRPCREFSIISVPTTSEQAKEQQGAACRTSSGQWVAFE